MNKRNMGDAAFMSILRELLGRAGLITMFLAMFITLYTDISVAGSGMSSKNVVGNKGVSGGTPSTRRIVGTWGYPGVAGPGGYPGVAGYGGYYPSWRHTQSKNYSGIAGNKGYPGISGNKGYSGVAGSGSYSGIAGNKSYSGIAGSSSYSGIAGDNGYPGIPGD